MLIAPGSLKKIATIKDVNILKIEIINECSALFNGIEVELLDCKFPDYKVVIPEYKDKMTFDRVQMIKNVKSVAVYSNKSTAQVNLHLNGDIKFMAEDVDFSFGSCLWMPYVSKSFKDTDIGFNGNFLRDALSIFKTSNVDMYSDGKPSQAAIFTDGNDKVLVTPLIINNY